MTGNADGVLISDETAESHDNLLIHNTFKTIRWSAASFLPLIRPTGHVSAPFAPHFGVNNNTVAENISTGNGVKLEVRVWVFFPMAMAPGASPAI